MLFRSTDGLGQAAGIPEQRAVFEAAAIGLLVLLLCLGVLATLLLIAIYVPVTGAGPSIQRAAVMGCAGLVAALADRPLTVHGDGMQSRDFTYVDNVVSANLLAGDAAATRGEILNVATGESITVNALADAIGELLGRPVEKLYEPAREADVRASWADLGEAKRVLGYEPLVGFADGLARTADHLLGGEEER